MKNNVCITGIGIITPSGNDMQENWKNMMDGRINIRPAHRWDSAGCQTDNYGEIYLTNDEILRLLENPPGSHKKIPLERGELLFYKAFEEAVKDSGIPIEMIKKSRTAMFVGTSLSGFTNLEEDYNGYVKAGKKIRLKSLLTYPLNTACDRVAYEFGLSGPRFLFSTACSASLHPLIWASDMIENDEIDLAIIGGADPLSLISMVGFSCLRSESKTACSPFSTTDPGVSIGEGAAVLILEKESDSIERNHAPRIIVAGYAGNSDAYHSTASDPLGTSIKKCIESAISGITDIESRKCFLIAHGTGTPHNDAVETRAINQVASLKGNLKVTSIKSMIGHTLGASGAIELALLVQSMRTGKALPTANFTQARPGCDLDYVRNKGIDYDMAVGIKSAFAFGGNNAVVSLVKDKNILIRKDAPIHEEPIAITGIGMINAYDKQDTGEIYDLLLSGVTAIKDIEPVFGFSKKRSVKRAAIADKSVLERVSNENRLKNYRKMDRISLLSTLAAAHALKDSGIKITSQNTLDIGLVTGTGTGALESVRNFYTEFLQKGVECADAGLFPNTVVNAHAGYITIELRIKGYTTVLAQGGLSGIGSICLARRALRKGICNAVIAGSGSEYSADYHRALIDLHAANDDFLVYDKATRGSVLGEGSAFFVLERLSDAIGRNAKIHALITDVFLDSYPVMPSTYRYERNPMLGLYRKIADKNYAPDLIIADGMGNKVLNRLETEAAKQSFGGTPITSLTGYFGNVPGVNSLNNLAMFTLSAAQGRIPHCINTTDPISDAIVVNKAIGKTVKYGLISGISDGGAFGAILCEGYGK